MIILAICSFGNDPMKRTGYARGDRVSSLESPSKNIRKGIPIVIDLDTIRFHTHRLRSRQQTTQHRCCQLLEGILSNTIPPKIIDRAGITANEWKAIVSTANATATDVSDHDSSNDDIPSATSLLQPARRQP